MKQEKLVRGGVGVGVGLGENIIKNTTPKENTNHIICHIGKKQKKSRGEARIFIRVLIFCFFFGVWFLYFLLGFG